MRSSPLRRLESHSSHFCVKGEIKLYLRIHFLKEPEEAKKVQKTYGKITENINYTDTERKNKEMCTRRHKTNYQETKWVWMLQVTNYSDGKETQRITEWKRWKLNKTRYAERHERSAPFLFYQETWKHPETPSKSPQLHCFLSMFLWHCVHHPPTSVRIQVPGSCRTTFCAYCQCTRWTKWALILFTVIQTVFHVAHLNRTNKGALFFCFQFECLLSASQRSLNGQTDSYTVNIFHCLLTCLCCQPVWSDDTLKLIISH